MRGTAVDPIAVTFTVDAGTLPAGYALERLSVLRDGELVGDCTGAAGIAAPDPCVAARRAVDGGDVELRVLTTELSTWTAVEKARPVAPPTGGGGGTDPGPGSGAGGDAGSGGFGGGATGGGGPGGGASPGPTQPPTTGVLPGAGLSGLGPFVPAPAAAPPVVALGRLPAARLATVLKRGLRLPVQCSASCRVRASVRVDGRTARRLGLARRATATVVATGSASTSTSSRTLTARYTARARKALRRARSVRFTVVLTATGGGTTKTRTVTNVVTVRR